MNRRRVISFESISGLIRAQMSLAPECSGCQCGPVKWRQPDGDGCNWILTKLEGANSLACLDQLVPLLNDLRTHFNVPEPRLHVIAPAAARSFRAAVPVGPLPEASALARTDALVESAEGALRESRRILMKCRTTKAGTVAQCRRANDVCDTARRMLEQRRTRNHGPTIVHP